MSKILVLFNSAGGEDYLADLFITSLILHYKNILLANYIPPYLFDNFSLSSLLYGKGYTAFRKIPATLQAINRINIQDPDKIFDLIETKVSFEFIIIFTSIWRYSKEIDRCLTLLSLGRVGKLIVLDGEDHSYLHPIANEPALTYYKRELLSLSSSIKPISFCLPVTTLPYIHFGAKYMPTKSTLLAPCDPRYRNSYIFPTESDYYKQYSYSFFACTTKKGGWDCLRHYEILANHCVPFFPDIEIKPKNIMSSYPVDLQIQANKLFEYAVLSSCRLDATFIDEYRIILAEFMNFFYGRSISLEYLNLL